MKFSDILREAAIEWEHDEIRYKEIEKENRDLQHRVFHLEKEIEQTKNEYYYRGKADASSWLDRNAKPKKVYRKKR